MLTEHTPLRPSTNLRVNHAKRALCASPLIQGDGSRPGHNWRRNKLRVRAGVASTERKTGRRFDAMVFVRQFEERNQLQKHQDKRSAEGRSHFKNVKPLSKLAWTYINVYACLPPWLVRPHQHSANFSCRAMCPEWFSRAQVTLGSSHRMCWESWAAWLLMYTIFSCWVRPERWALVLFNKNYWAVWNAKSNS